MKVVILVVIDVGGTAATGSIEFVFSTNILKIYIIFDI